MRMLTWAIAVLALAGPTGAHAQEVYLEEPSYAVTPAPVYVNPAPYYAGAPVIIAPTPYPAGPAIVAPAPTYVTPRYNYGYVYVPSPYTSATVVNSYTGRRCTIEPSGYRWCWTP